MRSRYVLFFLATCAIFMLPFNGVSQRMLALGGNYSFPLSEGMGGINVMAQYTSELFEDNVRFRLGYTHETGETSFQLRDPWGGFMESQDADRTINTVALDGRFYFPDHMDEGFRLTFSVGVYGGSDKLEISEQDGSLNLARRIAGFHTSVGCDYYVIENFSINAEVGPNLRVVKQYYGDTTEEMEMYWPSENGVAFMVSFGLKYEFPLSGNTVSDKPVKDAPRM